MNQFQIKAVHFFSSTILTFVLLKISIPTLKEYFHNSSKKRNASNSETFKRRYFVCSYLFFLALYQGFYLPLLAIPMSIVGLIDDKFNISKLARLAFK